MYSQLLHQSFCHIRGSTLIPLVSLHHSPCCCQAEKGWIFILIKIIFSQRQNRNGCLWSFWKQHKKLSGRKNKMLFMWSELPKKDQGILICSEQFTLVFQKHCASFNICQALSAFYPGRRGLEVLEMHRWAAAVMGGQGTLVRHFYTSTYLALLSRALLNLAWVGWFSIAIGYHLSTPGVVISRWPESPLTTLCVHQLIFYFFVLTVISDTKL